MAQSTPVEPYVVVFALYPRLTQLDFTGPFEVLSRLPGAQVHVASREGGAVRSDTKLEFSSLERLADIARCDLICVPGGPGTEEAAQDAVFLAEIRRLASGARYVTSVCTGSLILGAAGLLKGRRAACHWAWRDLLPTFGAIPVAERVVRDGNVVTGGGVTAGIDFALTVMADIAGERIAKAIQLSVEYAPAPPFDAGTPERAGAEIAELIVARTTARKDSFVRAHTGAAAE